MQKVLKYAMPLLFTHRVQVELEERDFEGGQVYGFDAEVNYENGISTDIRIMSIDAHVEDILDQQLIDWAIDLVRDWAVEVINTTPYGREY